MLKTVTKLEAAKRQLDTAIRLHLNEDDICAVQTLAWAALTLLRDLSESKPKVDTGYQFDRDTANFLKHADRDPKAVLLEINPIIPEFVFWEAIRLYQELGQALTVEMLAIKTVIDLKYGMSEESEQRAERRREEERARERRLEDMDEEEREEERQRLARYREAQHAAYMNVGREILAGRR